ncbi:MAG: indolepyruvate ferredoxin oxidoreductase family protein [Rubrivivax sp.]|nr:indolepyruvate ferredoxin oxidoreductase family protein [Rubrivivax sp.]
MRHRSPHGPPAHAMPTALKDVRLEDKYDTRQPRALLNGNQALVRALLVQRERDRVAGLSTAGYVSGYRGSPLGGLDQALWAAHKPLAAADITFTPGVNEDLAATAVWGTQQLAVMGDAAVDGVFGLWYGKGPGVDRSGDPIKHGNYMGTHPNGGVLAVMGDDHQGKSSTIAHHSQQAMAAWSVPVLYPADVSEFVPYALLGWALSRYSGCWVGFKVVNETVEQAMTCDLDAASMKIERPEKGPGAVPPEGIHYRGTFTPAADEMILRRYKLPLVQRFARANRIDRVMLGDAAPGGTARLGIVAAGKTWHEVRAALRFLGLDGEARARAVGLAVYKVGLLWPLEPEGLAEFAAGKKELFFVEDKAAFVEPQAAAILYNHAERPRITGKADESGAPLLNSDVGFEALDLAQVIAARLQANGLWDDALQQRLEAARSCQRVLMAVASPADVRRTPFFCSGCPHNTSTRLPEGSKALAGIGCHGMAVFRPGTMLPTQMGGEGANWVGLHRYTTRPHIFQNLGDGTYYHSGLLAIRLAASSGANITYKILYNDAVAMTGGQPIDGPISPVAIAHQVLAEGVQKLVVVTDDTTRHEGTAWPAGVRVEHRDRLDAVQRELRDTPGCTVLLYEQTCAAEKRRRRKKGAFPDPDRRMFIYDAVCEGCGDCSTQSSCVSIEPKETTLGRKRAINQSTCNKDYSCVKGFCPSFVTVEGGKPRRAKLTEAPEALFAQLPEPAVAAFGGESRDEAFGVMIPGIGGTGVITVGAVLAMAAHLEGKAASTYDMTGLSQKNGAVYSHLQVAPATAALRTHRLGLGDAALVLGFDMVAALQEESFRTLDPARSRFIGNHRVQPTAALTMNPDAKIDFGLLARKVNEKLGAADKAGSGGADRVHYLDATGLATALMGDAVYTNFLLVGAAMQLGWLPLSLAAVQRALELNGVQVEANLRALQYGRLAVHDAAAIGRLLGAQSSSLRSATPAVAQTLDEVIAERTRLLSDYQDAAYAARYAALVQRVREAERRAAGSEGELSLAVARYFAKLMAYKDEYEVARLYSRPEFRQRLQAEFDGVRELRFNLAPPLFAKRDAETGQLKKQEYGPWMLTAMGWLARLRFLRGGAFDVFGRTEERRAERALVDDYERRIDSLLGGLSRERLALAVQVAAVPEQIRGFGHVKERHLREAVAVWEGLAGQWADEPVAVRVARAA